MTYFVAEFLDLDDLFQIREKGISVPDCVVLLELDRKQGNGLGRFYFGGGLGQRSIGT